MNHFLKGCYKIYSVLILVRYAVSEIDNCDLGLFVLSI